MRTKRLNFVRFGVFLSIFPLCSFSSGTKSGSLSDYWGTTSYFTYDKYGKRFTGKSGEIPLGKRLWGVDYYLKYQITSYKRYSFSNCTGYPLDYKPVFTNPGSLTEYTLNISTSYFTEYTYSYSETITTQVSNAFSTGLNIAGMAQIKNETEIKQVKTNTQTYTFGFGKETTFTDSYVFDLTKVPSGYVFTPTVICEAQVFELSYDVVGRWWLGDSSTGLEGENCDKQKLVVYDPTTLFLTTGIKTINSGSLEPQYFLKV